MKNLICVLILTLGFGLVSTAAVTVDTPIDVVDVSFDVNYSILPIAAIAAQDVDVEHVEGWLPLKEYAESDDGIPIASIVESLGYTADKISVLTDEDYGGNELAHAYGYLKDKPIDSGTWNIPDDEEAYIDYEIYEDTSGYKTAVAWYHDGYGGQSGFSFIFINKEQEFVLKE